MSTLFTGRYQIYFRLGEEIEDELCRPRRVRVGCRMNYRLGEWKVANIVISSNFHRWDILFKCSTSGMFVLFVGLSVCVCAVSYTHLTLPTRSSV